MRAYLRYAAVVNVLAANVVQLQFSWCTFLVMVRYEVAAYREVDSERPFDQDVLQIVRQRNLACC